MVAQLVSFANSKHTTKNVVMTLFHATFLLILSHHPQDFRDQKTGSLLELRKTSLDKRTAHQLENLHLKFLSKGERRGKSE